MNPSGKKWPGVSIPEEDRDLIVRIGQQNGILKNIDSKDMLTIAAAMAVNAKAPEALPAAGRRIDIISPGNLNSYIELKQYIALIYFQTAGKKDLNSMADPKALLDNFVDYARRGLQLLKVNYLEAPDGNEKLEEIFVSGLSKLKK